MKNWKDINPDDPRLIRNKPVKRFYKWGIYVCDHKWPCYGGHTWWIANLLQIDYLFIGLCWNFNYSHSWNDGQHHYFDIGIISISWGGRPYITEV